MNAGRSVEAKRILEDKSSSVILSAKDIWFSYDGKTSILEGVNVSLKEGMMTMMLGRSGSGKTTFLKILARLIKPTRGEIVVSGNHPEVSTRTGIAYIPQNLGLVRSMTALDNVVMGALGYTPTIPSIFRRFPSEVYERAHKILSDLGIAAKSHKKVWNLSGGERQRVAIARALIQDPGVILADEFVAHLDAVTSMEILSLMKKLTESRIAFLIATHDVALVRKYADSFIIMKNGKISPEYCPAILLAEEILEEIK